MLYSSVPRGSFTLPSRLPPKSRLGLIAAGGGSGTTPLFGMLRCRYVKALPDERLLRTTHYKAKSLEMMILRASTRGDRPCAIPGWIQWYYLSSGACIRMTADAITATEAGDRHASPDWQDVGPEPRAKRDLIVELEDPYVRPEQIHTEVFAVQQAPSPSPRRQSDDRRARYISLPPTPRSRSRSRVRRFWR
jgi:ferredoxin-NADP reductase